MGGFGRAQESDPTHVHVVSDFVMCHSSHLGRGERSHGTRSDRIRFTGPTVVRSARRSDDCALHRMMTCDVCDGLELVRRP
jgi:hypothetical protein